LKTRLFKICGERHPNATIAIHISVFSRVWTLTTTEICRLCAGPSTTVFTATLLKKYDVDYLHCGQCHSLQTQQPFWLDEAYAHNLGDMDCGAAQRNLSSATAAMIVAKLWKLRDAVDHGGGDGLLCRLLRDYGLNCFVEDKYAAPTYAQGYSTPDFESPDVVFAFEVFEHFVDPAVEIAQLFAKAPKILFGSTQQYVSQGKDWGYLSRHSGHHIFFYSDGGMAEIGKKHGYRAVRSGPYFLFIRGDLASAAKIALFRMLTQKVVLRLLRGVLVVAPHRGVARDIADMRESLGRV
jgi:hypothetical protein